MTAHVAALCAAAVLCLPSGTQACARLTRGPAQDRWRNLQRLRELVVRAGRRRCVLAGTAASLVALLGVLPVLAAVALSSIVGLAVHLAWTTRTQRAERAGEDASIDCVAALAAELRAGRPPATALATVAEHAAGFLQRPLAEAARTAALGGDTPSVLREAVGSGDLRRLAAAWQLSVSSGCSLAGVLDAVDADLRARRQLSRLLSGLLSGPRATAGLLALLPALGLAMGAGLGADPLHVLTATGPGQLALVAGVGLDVAGVLWTARLVRGAGG